MNETTEQPVIHTEEMADIISAPPAWLLRWGLSLFLSVIIMLLALAGWVTYPEIIKVPMKLYAADTSPVAMSTIDGKILVMRVVPGQTVQKGDTLAIVLGILSDSSQALLSPVSGSVTILQGIRPGMIVSRGQEMFYINVNSSEFQGELQIPQNDFRKFRPGQEVLIKFSSYPYTEFGIIKGIISSVNILPNGKGNFPAKVDILPGQKLRGKAILRPGLQAEADIIVGKETLLKMLVGKAFKLSH